MASGVAATVDMSGQSGDGRGGSSFDSRDDKNGERSDDNDGTGGAPRMAAGTPTRKARAGRKK